MKKLILRLDTAIFSLLFVLLPVLVSRTANATPTQSEYYISGGNSTSNAPLSIAPGPDGALWFTGGGQGGGLLGRITTSGSSSLNFSYPVSAVGAKTMTNTSDGILWIAETTKSILRVASSTDMTEFPTPSNLTSPRAIVAGPDGNIWFNGMTANNSYLVKMTPTGLTTMYGLPTTVNGDPLYSLSSGPDGNIWFTASGGYIGKMTTGGALTVYPSSLHPYNMAAGPDNAIWATDNNAIDRIAMDGTITAYPLGTGAHPKFIALGPDGALWYTQFNSSTNQTSVGRMTITGSTATYPTLASGGSDPSGITAGPDGAMWYTETGANKIARISVDPPSAPTGLSATSPAQNPQLSWNSTIGATSYNIYRDSIKIGSSTTPTYTDNSATEGSHNYYVTATNIDGESSASSTISVVVDRTAPTVTVSPGAPNNLNSTVNFTITINDANALSSAKNISVPVNLYDTTGSQKSVASTLNLSSGLATYTVNTSSLDDGDASLNIGVVYDAAGNPSRPVYKINN